MKDLKETIKLANKNYETLQRIEKTYLPKASESDSRNYEKLGGFALDALKGVFQLEHYLEFYENLWKS